MDWSHAGRIGNWLTINGKKTPEYNLKENSFARLRFINSSNARILKFNSDLDHHTIIAIDGSPTKPIIVKNFTLGPGQRVDLSINTKNKIKINFFEISQTKSLKVFSLNINKINKKINSIKKYEYKIWQKLPSLANSKTFNIHMQGGAMGNLSKAKINGVEKDFRTLAFEDKKLWAFNKNIGSYDYLIAKISKNDVVVLNVWNDSRWHHAMHLHGNHFFVKSKEFIKKSDYILRDTYLMRPGERSELIFVADNIGKWLFHCHMLEHAASGMVGFIEVI